MTTSTPTSTRLLIDTSSLMYRAYFALPTSITDPQGNPVNAVRGYLDMVSTVIAEGAGAQGPATEVRHCWDHAEVPQGRLDAYPGYKSQRTAAPEDLIAQFGLLRRVLAALGETVVEAEGWEADDAIGTLVAERDEGTACTVLTGDRDLLQLVSDPWVQVAFTVSGTKNLKVYDEALVAETFGVPADRYVDFAILRGDPSDGLPGVKGVGEKTARKLVADHASLDAMVAAADQLTPKLGATIAASADYLAAMAIVVPVQTDRPLTSHQAPQDTAEVARLTEAHALSGPMERWQERTAGVRA